MVSEVTSNCGLSLIYHPLQFVALTQLEHRNFTQYRHIFSFRKMVHGVPKAQF